MVFRRKKLLEVPDYPEMQHNALASVSNQCRHLTTMYVSPNIINVQPSRDNQGKITGVK